MYRAIIKDVSVVLKPSIDSRRPSAAMTAPPGTPGAATIVIPSMRINGNMTEKDVDMPFSIMTAIEQETRVMVLPDR